MISKAWNKFYCTLHRKAKLVRFNRPFMQYPLNTSKREPSWENRGISSQINPCHRTTVTEKTVCSQLFNFATFCTTYKDISLLWSDSSKTTMQLSAGKEISDVMINKTALTWPMLREDSLQRNQILQVPGMKYQHHPVVPLICFLLVWVKRDCMWPGKIRMKSIISFWIFSCPLSYGWC